MMKFLFILLFFIWTPFYVAFRPENKLQKILRSDKFYITNTEYGGFFKVVDSISFKKTSENIIMEFFPGSKEKEKITGTITDKDLKNIELILRPRPIFSKRCATSIVSVFNFSDTVGIVDERCKKRIIEKLKEIVVTRQ